MSLSVKEAVSPEEWALRQDLACAYRLVAHFGWDDLIFTHLSVRVPGGENHFLLNPYNLLFEEITASNLLKVDLEGKLVMDSPYVSNRAGFIIHSAIHAARHDAQAVVHLHTDCGQAVAAQKAGLLPLTQTALAIIGTLTYHDFEGLAIEADERQRIVADLGDRSAMILRNHGTLTVGPTIGSAFTLMYFLERACQAQCLALAGNQPLNTVPMGTPEKTARQVGDSGAYVVQELIWPALRRKMERLDPGFLE